MNNFGNMKAVEVLTTDDSTHKSKYTTTQFSATAGFSSLICWIASSAATKFLQAIITVQPCLTRDLVVSKPIPAFAPVIMATFPLKSLPCKT